MILMEPKYLNGDVALLRKLVLDYDGLIYAVVYNEETYMKAHIEEDKVRENIK